MLKQSSLFNAPAWTKPVEVNKTVATEDRKRLSAQCSKLLKALVAGPRTNVELMADMRIFNLSARASELRQAGCTVTSTRTKEAGVFLYRLDYYPADLIGGGA